MCEHVSECYDLYFGLCVSKEKHDCYGVLATHCFQEHLKSLSW